MPEDAVKRELNHIKSAIIKNLRDSGHQIIKSTNEPVCVIGVYMNQYRFILGHFRSIPHSYVKRLESLPSCADDKIRIIKEIWLRDKGELKFYQVIWDDRKSAWIDQFGQSVKFRA
jgi:hypothetical protein